MPIDVGRERPEPPGATNVMCNVLRSTKRLRGGLDIPVHGGIYSSNSRRSEERVSGRTKHPHPSYASKED